MSEGSDMIMTSTRRILLLLAAVSWLAFSGPVGCGAPQEKDDLYKNVKAFHQHMRWGRYHEASGFLQTGEREAFLGRHEELGDDFRVVEYEIKSIKVVKVNETAEAEVVLSWIREPDMRVHKDKIVELWQRRDGRWVLAEREVMRKKP
jgi:hypothetical protein